MSALSPARKAALSLISERRRRDGRIRDIARSSDALRVLSPADRALSMRLAVGAVATSSQLNDIIDSFVSRPSALEPRVRDALLVSAFEICHLDTPSAVAVSQGVELVRMVSRRAAGMANAVLRRVADEVLPTIDSTRERCKAACDDAHRAKLTAGDLALVSGLPEWLVARVVEEWGMRLARDFALGNLEPAPVFVSANLAMHDEDEVRDLLEGCGLGPVDAGHVGAFLLTQPQGLYASGLVEACDLVVADLAAQRVCFSAGPQPGTRILEVGQGRGTKTILLQSIALMHGGLAEVVGVDSVASKVQVARERMERAGLSEHVTCVCLDATLLGDADAPTEAFGTFDLVFVDAPCSGTGTMRRHPEIASKLTPEDVSELASLQLRLLEAASSKVSPKGRLVYATCSILREENLDVVDAFLAGRRGAEFEHCGGMIGCPPGVGTPDGHFCAVMSRR